MLIRCLFVTLTIALFSCFSWSTSKSVSYRCIAEDPEQTVPTQFKLTIKGDVIVLNDQEEAKRDMDYKPHNDNKGNQRFHGDFETLGLGGDGYTIELVINRYLVEGARVGYLEVRATGEGFFLYTYKCTRQ